MSPCLLNSIVLAITVSVASGRAVIADEAVEVFEKSIRPVLIDRCSQCHGAHKQNGGLRIDSLAAMLKGGDSGPAVVPDQPQKSLLIAAVERSEELAMPPDSALTKHEIDALKIWIAQGAKWPQAFRQLDSKNDQGWRDHWAFLPITKPKPPVIDTLWPKTKIDAFILEKLSANALSPSSQADRRTLLRRASYDLTGLPPSPEAVNRFVADNRTDAWDRVIVELLESPRYGEQGARHWLDMARYADTKGYVYAREERFWIHAWAYRDWVVQALNNDIPYDRFLLLQIAADQVADRETTDQAAMGFLTLGRRFLGIKHDIIDDRIDVVCRSTMGLTVACARCHDHKYDPIPTADYYSLYGVFDSCYEKVVPIGQLPAADADFTAELAKRQKTLTAKRQKTCADASQRNRDRIGEYLVAQTELNKYPQAGFDQIISVYDIHPRTVHRWNRWLINAGRRNDPVFRAWFEFSRLLPESFARDAGRVTQKLKDLPMDKLNPIIADRFQGTPTSFRDVVQWYTEILQGVNDEWKRELKLATDNNAPRPVVLTDPDREQLRQALYGDASPCTVPDIHISNIETLLPSSEVTQLWKNQGEVDRWLIQSKHNLPHALTLADRPAPLEPRIFRRGSPTNPGGSVSRHFLTLFSEASKTPQEFSSGSGRRELADAIVDPDNPLTARVIVNRIWAQHFGRGLVSTPSDFGLRAEVPSHPELLDWLALWFVENGWQLKKLHRLIMNSAVYQQASTQHTAATVSAARHVDPDNRLLWRMKQHRLTFEEFRDSLLQASGELQHLVGGKPFDLFAVNATPRRSIYGLVDRQYLPAALRTFDFPNPDLHVARRPQTTVPQQALFFMNHPMVLKQVRSIAEMSEQIQDASLRIEHLFRRILQRAPEPFEIHDALQLVVQVPDKTESPVPETAADWSYGYGHVDETTHTVINFKAAPHFTGTAWQGSDNWPDPKLGWVNLTAVGGHPGNTRQHACVRRWIAPRDMTIKMESQLTHEPTVGDGVRAFVLTGDGRELYFGKVHQQSVEVSADAITVGKGDIIDFVVDINDVLNNDQFLWHIVVESISASGDDATEWDSEKDFTRNTVTQLSPWEQLVHVMLCTNEFMFVD